MDDVAGLRARRAELHAELRSLRRPLRNLQEQERKRRRLTREAAAATLSPRDRQLILCTFWMVDFVVADALTLLEQVRGPPAWGSLEAPGRGTLVEDLFLATDIHEVEAWVDATREENLPRMVELWVIHAEWRTAQWVARVNNERGVAPSSMLVYDRNSQHLRSTPEAVQHRCPRHRTANAKRLWAVRWRQRWGAAMGTLNMGDVDPPDVLLEKAWQRSKFLRPPPSKWDLFWPPGGLILGSVFASTYWPRKAPPFTKMLYP